jgi:predicted metal-dependent phosphoesterase TrpH
MGYNISWELVCSYAMQGTTVYKQHIMHALMDLGYCDEINGDLHAKLFSRSANEAGKALVPLSYPDAAEAIRAIRMAGGVAVLAHPGQLGNFEAIEEWASLGLQGVEAYHPAHSSEDTRKALQLAEKYQLIVTGGADYHGIYGSANDPLGSVTVGEQAIRELQKIRDQTLDTLYNGSR